MQRKEKLYLAFTAVCTAILCHVLFSPYGFNPTDEGFVLSSSVRLLHGQIPHIDFTSLRPIGYGYLHIPELLIDKDHTFLISRFVYWLELSCIAYLWVLILLKSTKYEVQSSNYGMSILLFFVTFIFNAHYFPIAVLHTIDGLLFAVAGFYILMRYDRYAWLGGLLVGFSVLCKQGYAVLIPLLIFLYPEKRQAWLSAFVPGILYVAWISTMGGLKDLYEQLTAHTELLDVGILNYILNPWLFGGILLSWTCRKLRIDPLFAVLALLTFIIVLLVSNHYHGQGLLLLFGYALAQSFFEAERRQLYLLALTLAWCVSISVGYASIALFSGGLAGLLLVPYTNCKDRSSQLAIWVFVSVSAVIYVYVRVTNIYRDGPRSELAWNLDGIVDGGHGIYTNARTYAVLKELDSLREQHPGLLVLPDHTAIQVFDHKRPMLTEWPNRTEVPNDRILSRVVRPLESDSSTLIALPRYRTDRLAYTLAAADLDDYRIVRYVRNAYRPADGTRFFELLQK